MSPKIAISTLTLGRPEAGHDLATKIRIAAETGFDGIEINWFCLKEFAKSLQEASDYDRLRSAAQKTKDLIDELKLEAVSLAPLMNYDVCLFYNFENGFIEYAVLLGLD
jgi:sugar phosphate isomerase/epimerase